MRTAALPGALPLVNNSRLVLRRVWRVHYQSTFAAWTSSHIGRARLSGLYPFPNHRLGFAFRAAPWGLAVQGHCKQHRHRRRHHDRPGSWGPTSWRTRHRVRRRADTFNIGGVTGPTLLAAFMDGPLEGSSIIRVFLRPAVSATVVMTRVPVSSQHWGDDRCVERVRGTLTSGTARARDCHRNGVVLTPSGELERRTTMFPERSGARGPRPSVAHPCTLSAGWDRLPRGATATMRANYEFAASYAVLGLSAGADPHPLRQGGSVDAALARSPGRQRPGKQNGNHC